MKRLKQILISLLCIAFLLPTIVRNNVYADVGGTPINNTISAASSVDYRAGHDGGHIDDDNTSVNYDLRKYDRASFTWSCGLYDNRGNYDWATSYVSMTMTDKNSGEVLASFSKRYNNPSRGSWGDTITWDLAALKTNGKDLSNVVFTSGVTAGTTYYNMATASVSNVTLVALSPAFTGTLASGNLTPVNLDTSKPKAEYNISASNTEKIAMYIDGIKVSEQNIGDSKFEVNMYNTNVFNNANGRYYNPDSNGYCQNIIDNNGNRCKATKKEDCGCHKITFVAIGANGKTCTLDSSGNSIDYDNDINGNEFKDLNSTKHGSIIHVDYNPIVDGFNTGCDDKNVIEGSPIPLIISGYFPKTLKQEGMNISYTTDGYFEWQYYDNTKGVWEPINNSTNVLDEDTSFIKSKTESKTEYYKKKELFGINNISGAPTQDNNNLATSCLSVFAKTKDLQTHIKCVLKPEMAKAVSVDSGIFRLKILDTSFDEFSVVNPTQSIGYNFYDTSIVVLTYKTGEQRCKFGDMRNEFITSYDGKSLYNVIDLDSNYLTSEEKQFIKTTFYAIANGSSSLSSDGSGGIIFSNGTSSETISGIAPYVSDFNAVTKKEKIELYKAVLRYMADNKGVNKSEFLEKITDGDGKNGNHKPVKIAGGENLYFAYLRPLNVCTCESFADTDSDGHCDSCGNIRNTPDSKFENNLFASVLINGLDTDAPEVTLNSSCIKWGQKVIATDYDEGSEYKPGLQFSNGQSIVLTAKIKDSNVSIDKLNIKWYKNGLEIDPSTFNGKITLDKTNSCSILEINAAEDAGGKYSVSAEDPTEVLGSGKTTYSDSQDIGNPWDKTPPVVPKEGAETISSFNSTSTYKKLTVNAVDNENGCGLPNNAYIITTDKNFNIANATENMWSSVNSEIYETACTVYVYVRDKAGNIKKEEYNIRDIDHEAPSLIDLSAENSCTNCGSLITDCSCSPSEQHAVVRLKADAVDNVGGTPKSELLFRFDYVLDNNSSDEYGFSATNEELAKEPINRNYHMIRDFEKNPIIEVKDSGYFRVQIRDKAKNTYISTLVYVDRDFLTGNIGDIFSESGTGYTDLEGGFIDHKGGCKDELGGFNDTKGGRRDGFYDHDGGFTDKGHGIDDKTFIDECGYINTDGYDFNAFVDAEGFVNLSGYVDVKSCKDLKGKPGKDYRCDLCGLSRIKCLCKDDTGGRGYIDDETGNGYCDNNTEIKVEDCTTHNSPDGKCDKCGQNYNNCSCKSDGLCDKCYKVHDVCEHIGQNSYDGLCDVCFNNRDKCTCRGTGVDGSDGLCDVCHNPMGNDGNCPRCMSNKRSDNKCDICGLTFEAHLNLNNGDPCAAKDGICDNCSFSRSKCICKNSSGVIGPDGLCDVCGKLYNYEDIKGKLNNDCICGDGLCDGCSKPYYECICGDGICDVCGNNKQNCTCGNPNGHCDVCGRALTSCICGDGFCDNEGCGKPEKDCECKDHLCDKCEHTFDEDEGSEHKGFCTDTDCRDCKDLLCDNDLCKNCGRNEKACTCGNFEPLHVCGLPETCPIDTCTKKDKNGRCYQYDLDENGKKVYHHCVCGDGICDVCGKTKEQGCSHIGGSVSFTISDKKWTKDKVTLIVTSTGNILAADKPFSWWDPKTETWGSWTNTNTKEVTENGEYNVRVKTSTGFVKEAHRIVVSNIDRTAPIIKRPKIVSGTREIIVNVQDLSSVDDKSVGCSGISKICYIYTDEAGNSNGIEHQFSQLPDTDHEDDEITCRSMMDKFGTYQIVAYDNAGNKGYAQSPVVLTRNGVKTDSPFLQDEPSPSQMKERFITIEPETWTNDFVTIKVNFASNEGLASNPYEWNGQVTNSPTYKVYDNETVKLTILDSYLHEFPVEDIVITNIDKLAPEFTIDYDKNNGNKVKITAEDKGVGLAAIFWKSTTSPTLTKVMDIPESKSIGVNEFELDIPKMDIYKIYVSDKLGNISKEDSSHEFSASYAIDNTSSGSNGGSSGSDSSTGNSSSSIEEMLKLLGALNGSNSGNANNGYTQGSSLSDSTIQKLLSSLGSNSNSSGTNNPPYNYGNYYPSGATSSKTTSDSSTSKAQNLTNPYGNSSPVINVNTAEEKEEDEEEVKRAQVKEDENKEEVKEESDNNELSPDDYQKSSIDLDEFSFDTGADNDTPLSEEEENNSDEPKKSSKALWAILIALGTIALGGGAFYIYKQKKFSNDLIEDDDDLFGTGEEDTQDISEISEEDINKDFEDDIEEDIE